MNIVEHLRIPESCTLNAQPCNVYYFAASWCVWRRLFPRLDDNSIIVVTTAARKRVTMSFLNPEAHETVMTRAFKGATFGRVFG